jgi:hypothetical protein
VDIRQCLVGDGKHREESSPKAAKVARMVCGGRRWSGLMMTIPRTKEALGSEDQLCEKELPNGGAKRWLASGDWAVVAYLGYGENSETGRSFPRLVAFIGIGGREGVVLVPHIGDNQPTAH